MQTEPVNNKVKDISLKRIEIAKASNGDKYLLLIPHGRSNKPLFHIKIGDGMPEALIDEEA
jgi:hypothetical protein